MKLLTYKLSNLTFALVDKLFQSLYRKVASLEHHVNHLLWFPYSLCRPSFEQPQHLSLLWVPLLNLLMRLLMPLLLVLLYSYLHSFLLDKLTFNHISNSIHLNIWNIQTIDCKCCVCWCWKADYSNRWVQRKRWSSNKSIRGMNAEAIAEVGKKMDAIQQRMKAKRQKQYS